MEGMNSARASFNKITLDGTLAGEIRDDYKVELVCMFREECAHSVDLSFFADADAQPVTCAQRLTGDMRAYEASCAGDEDEGLGHLGCCSKRRKRYEERSCCDRCWFLAKHHCLYGV